MHFLMDRWYALLPGLDSVLCGSDAHAHALLVWWYVLAVRARVGYPWKILYVSLLVGKRVSLLGLIVPSCLLNVWWLPEYGILCLSF